MDEKLTACADCVVLIASLPTMEKLIQHLVDLILWKTAAGLISLA